MGHGAVRLLGARGVLLVAGVLAAVAATTPHQGSIVSAGPVSERGPRGAGGPGGETPPPPLVTLLQGAGTRWAAATSGAQGAASLQFAGGAPVMALGGFSGSDPAPTLAEFRAAVATGQVRYYVEGGGPGGGPGDAGRAGGPGARGTSGAIRTWVQEHFTPIDVAGRTVYDLGAPRS